jgi:beta-fructofuranosidase
LTLPRELTLENQQLRQKPVQELTSLRKETLYEQELELVDQLLPAQAEIFELELSQLQLSSDQLEVKLRVSEQEETVLRYDQQTNRFTIDRGQSGAEVPALDYGTTRSITLTEPLHTLRVFVDRSSVEVFLNDGEAVASARIFPKTTSQGIVLTGDATAHLAIYSL